MLANGVLLFFWLIILLRGLISFGGDLAVSDQPPVAPLIKGIYLTQGTVENTKLLNRLVRIAKVYGINTFVVDCQRDTKNYRNNVALIKKNNIKYVARIIVFPGGGTDEQVLFGDYWVSRYRLVDLAVQLGAQEVQLDYIRYRNTQPSSPENAENIYRVINWFKQNLQAQHIPLAIDVFGIASFGSSPHIGQDLQLFSGVVDAVCPMVYPSHYAPYSKYIKIPYKTVYSTLNALYAQFNQHPGFKVYPYIEVHNARGHLSSKERLNYVYQQIKAVEDSHANGWLAWSPSNKYETLFRALQLHKSI